MPSTECQWRGPAGEEGESAICSPLDHGGELLHAALPRGRPVLLPRRRPLLLPLRLVRLLLLPLGQALVSLALLLRRRRRLLCLALGVLRGFLRRRDPPWNRS